MGAVLNRSTFVAYYRVSTDRQGKSGLGLDAQKFAVSQFLSIRNGVLKAEFTEILSGAKDDRPELAEALRLCKLTNSTLLIAKLDRLSRNLAFLATLQQAGTRFVACDLPEANELVIHILAAVAQAERKAISERTVLALAAAKARGVQLGNPRLKPGTRETALVATRVRQELTRKKALNLKEVIENAEGLGFKSLKQIATYLNELGIPSMGGGDWHATSVSRVRSRLASEQRMGRLVLHD